MTFEGDTSVSGGTFLKGLVVVAILLAAWWGASGGLDSIPVPVPEQTTTTVISG